MVTSAADPRRRRGMGVAGAALAALALTGCEISGTAAPTLEPRAVVHAVLNPTGSQQIVIVERTLSSIAFTPNGSPVRQPIANARVVIYGPREDSAVATQAAGAGDGIYRVPSVTITDGSAGTAPPTVLRVRPGERYRLRVETELGVTTGTTVIPVGGPADAARRTFNLDRDTLRLSVAGVRNAAGFLLRHETRFNADERYVATLDEPLVLPLARVAGDPDDAEWAFEFARGLIVPGLPQTFAVVAVDSNYFKYNVAGFDPFGDDTRGNTLTGGVGLFGAVAPLMAKTLDLTADIDSPIEGSWSADRNSVALPLTMSLFASPYFPRPGPARVAVSGSGRTFFGRTVEIYGRSNGDGLSMDFVDTAAGAEIVAATGLLTAGTVVLTDVRTGERVTYRRR